LNQLVPVLGFLSSFIVYLLMLLAFITFTLTLSKLKREGFYGEKWYFNNKSFSTNKSVKPAKPPAKPVVEVKEYFFYPNCDSKIESETTFCPYCGTKLK